MNKIAHEEFVEMKRKEIVSIAKKIIEDSIDIIEGCRKINSLWLTAELPEDDSFDFFELIDSDTESFPKGYLREISSPEYLKEQDKKEKKYLASFEKEIKNECQALIEKYGK